MTKITVKKLIVLNFIAKLFAIYPLNRTPSKKSAQYFYSGFMVLLFITFHTYIFSKTYEFWYRNKPIETTIVVTYLFMDCFTLIANVSSVIWLTLLKRKKFLQILEKLQRFEEIFKSVNVDAKNRTFRINVKMIVSQVCFGLYAVFHIHRWAVNFGWNFSQIFCLKAFTNFQQIVLALTFRCHVLLIKFILLDVRYVLNETVIDKQQDKIFHTTCVTADVWDIKRIRRLYCKISELIDDYNDLFGFALVLIYTVIFANIIVPINILLVYGDGESDLNGIIIGSDMIIVMVTWIFIPILCAIILIKTCDEVCRELKQLTKLSYQLSLDVADGHKSQELESLAKQIVLTKTDFEAGGSFTMSYRTILQMLGGLVSYIIVLIQLHNL